MHFAVESALYINNLIINYLSMKISIFIIIIFSYSSSFASEFSSSQLEDLKKKWLNNEPYFYKYTLRHGGPFGYSLYKITIKNGICKAKSRFVFGKKKSSWESSSCDGRKIHELIFSVQTQELQGTIRSDIKINSEYNFIDHYYVDTDTEYEDQSWYFDVFDFKTK